MPIRVNKIRCLVWNIFLCSSRFFLSVPTLNFRSSRQVMITPIYPREETTEEAIRRFEIECEFVQSLANPNYLNCKLLSWLFIRYCRFGSTRFLQGAVLHQLSALSSLFQTPRICKVSLLSSYLFFFPFRTLKYPQCLYMLEAVQHADFREALAVSTNAKYIEDQLLLQWHFYLRKRARLFVSSIQYASQEELPTRF